MAFSHSNTAEGGTDGVAVTTSNSGGASGDAWSTVSLDPAGSIEFSNFTPAHGALGYALNMPASGTTAHRLIKNVSPAEAGRVCISGYVQFDNVPTAFEDVCGIRHSAGNMGVLVVGTDGKWILQNSAGAGISASRSTDALVADRRYRVELAVTKGTTTSNGRIEYAIYDVASSDSTAIWTYDTTAAVNTNIFDVAAYYWGRSTGRTQANVLYPDTLRADTMASGFHTAYVASNTAPTCNMGADVGNIEPWSTVTLTSAASDDPDGTIVDWEISQTAGTSVGTISGTGPTWTYTAPAVWGGTTATFQGRVQDDDGAWSAWDTVVHTILSPTEAICGSPPTPIRMQIF